MNRITKIFTALSLFAFTGGAMMIYNLKKISRMARKVLEESGVRNITRSIDKIIIHCSATKPNQECTVELIDKWHKARGFDGIGYHYVIYKDGTVRIGRPVEKQGAHTSGQNEHSIGVCYVGGLDNNAQAKDTRTPQQKQALRAVVNYLLEVFPSAQVYGHRDFANKACPCFDVKTEL